jgi:hypothetical protein
VCRFDGVRTATLRLSRVGVPASDLAGQSTDLTISKANPVEMAVTRPAYIEVI